MTDASDLHLLMVRADDHAPALAEGLPEASARDQGDERRPSVTDRLWDEGGDPNDLALQRWGILAPEGTRGDRLLELVRPLVLARQDQQGAPVRVYRVPPGLTPEAAARWHRRAFDERTSLGIDTPRFQLILGDLDEVSLGVQQIQSAGGFVGRLAFADDAGYAAYVDKVLRWERRPAPQPLARALFFTVHDGTAATRTGHRSLVEPALQAVRRHQLTGEFPAREVVALGEPDTTPDELLDAAASSEPGVLFSVSHGEGAPRGGWRDPGEQRRRQGAMSFGREGRLTGDDLRGRVFMPGGVWCMLACNGAGTPATSGYDHWLRRLAAADAHHGDVAAVLSGLAPTDLRPFVAALPQAALSSADGPLGFIGHVDLAWAYSFMDNDAGGAPRPARFMRLVRALCKRDRLGVAMRELTRYYEQTNAELTSLVDAQAQAAALGLDHAADDARQGHLWMLRQDLAGYVALGDPAVRLGLAAPATSATHRDEPAIEVRTSEDITSAPSGLAHLDRLEEAIAHVMLGDVALATLAAGVGRTRGELERLAAAYRDAGRKTLAST